MTRKRMIKLLMGLGASRKDYRQLSPAEVRFLWQCGEVRVVMVTDGREPKR